MSTRRFLKREHEPKQGQLDSRLDGLRDYCLGKLGATEEFPFGSEVMVFKVGGKMFGAFAWDESPLRISLKCNPDRVPALREEHAAIQPPRYFNKKHWNAIVLEASIDDDFLHELVDHSYDLVWNALTRKVRAQVEESTA